MAIQAPTLAAITLNPTGGGIAGVARLLWRMFEEDWGERARLVTMFEHDNRPASFAEKVKFSMAVAAVQALEQTDFVLFAHLGLARVQDTLPDRMRRPYGVFLHGIEAWQPLDEVQLRALAGAEVRFASSNYTASRVRETHPSIGPIEICPLALLPTPSGQEPDRAPPLVLGPHAVLTVGRMDGAEAYKGHDQLIEAWPRVVSRIPDAQLVVVGDGDDAPRLRRKADSIPEGGSILFTGFVSSTALEDLYARAALFALPSRGEGFGLVYVEAMAHGLACIGSIHDAARELIRDDETGRLVDQSDIGAMADTIAGLLDDRTLRQRMGEAGRRRVVSEFTFERFSDRMRALLPCGNAMRPALTSEA
jgi:phosphatidylinositol alpha-1,6-mannosyltransferase